VFNHARVWMFNIAESRLCLNWEIYCLVALSQCIVVVVGLCV
jgi:hypothetical protein